MAKELTTLAERYESHGLSRRDFTKACLALTAMLGLKTSMLPTVVQAAETKKLPVVVWLHGHECTGCDEALLRSSAPHTSDLVLNMIALEYHHTLASSAGHPFEDHLDQVIEEYKGQYILCIEGAIPLAEDGIFCMVGGHTFEDHLKKCVEGAAAVMEIGSCATWGGIQAAAPNPTGSTTTSAVISGVPVVKIPGCPPIPEVIAATIMHYALFGTLPPLDSAGRPKQFFGQRIHDTCYKRPFFDSGMFAEHFDDEGARKGWCLYKLGCRGPSTYNSCGNLRWWNGLSYPIQSGHGCIGCSEDGFWDNDHFYDRMPNVPLPNTVSTTDKVFLGAAGAVTAAVAVHGVATAVVEARHDKKHADEENREV